MGVTDRTAWRRLQRGQLDESQIYDVLKNDRRRRAFLCLREQRGETGVTELATSVAHLEADSNLSAADCKESVYNSLHQTHLPKLEELDIVEYDEQSKVVTLTANAAEIDRYLRLRSGYGFFWEEYYQLLSVTSLLSILCAELDVSVFGGVETVPVVTLSLAVLAASVTYQVWTRRWIYLRSLL